MDLVLSSGFLAFGAHTGFLAAVEELGLPVDAVCGTSSGALIGALWAAGMPAREVFAEVTRHAPLAWARPHLRPWRGLLSLGPMVDELRRRLPPRFSDLSRPFGVGVVVGGAHHLVTDGALPEAVAASCAIPWVFAPVPLEVGVASDGGAVDRTGISPWRSWRGPRATVVHQVDRSHGAADPELPADLVVVRSARSGASLWSLGPVDRAFEVTRADTRSTLGVAGGLPVTG